MNIHILLVQQRFPGKKFIVRVLDDYFPWKIPNHQYSEGDQELEEERINYIALFSSLIAPIRFHVLGKERIIENPSSTILVESENSTYNQSHIFVEHEVIPDEIKRNIGAALRCNITVKPTDIKRFDDIIQDPLFQTLLLDSYETLPERNLTLADHRARWMDNSTRHSTAVSEDIFD